MNTTDHQWAVYETEPGRVHVAPFWEWHDVDGGVCWCGPERDGVLVIHRDRLGLMLGLGPRHVSDL